MEIQFNARYDTGHTVDRKIEHDVDPLFFDYKHEAPLATYMQKLLTPVVNLIGVELDAKHFWVSWWVRDV